MSNKLDSLIQDVAEETFETLAYMFPIPADEESHADVPSVAASVVFSGPFGGTLAVSIDQAMLGELTGNMLGVMDPSEVTDEQQIDGLKELLNVICGNLLPKLAGLEAVFDVLAPHILEDGSLPDQFGGHNPVGYVIVELDSGRAKLALFAEADIPVIAAMVA